MYFPNKGRFEPDSSRPLPSRTKLQSKVHIKRKTTANMSFIAIDFVFPPPARNVVVILVFVSSRLSVCKSNLECRHYKLLAARKLNFPISFAYRHGIAREIEQSSRPPREGQSRNKSTSAPREIRATTYINRQTASIQSQPPHSKTTHATSS